MTDATPLLGLPYILPAQAQKHVTHNTAIDRLDAIAQLAVLTRDHTHPPADPAEGDRHIVGTPAGGEWAGSEGQVAAFQNGGWVFLAPRAGWRARDLSVGADLVHNGTDWATADLGAIDRLGIGTGADETNRLAVASDAVLLTHDGGDTRLKLNKAGEGDTASLTFQTAFSGRAEIGTAGSDALAVKVSADGATWTTALGIGPDGLASGAAVQSGATDATPGRLLTTGAFGTGATSGVALPGGDLDASDTPAGDYAVTDAMTGTRPDAASAGLVEIRRAGAGIVFQTFLPATGPLARFTRRGTSGGWTAWV